MKGKCLEEKLIKHNVILPEYDPFVQSVRKKIFTDPLLPDHINDKTIFGIKIKSGIPISELIFPNKLQDNIIVEDESNSELYKISHHNYKTAEQLNRKYTADFNPDNRFGKCSKYIPPGLWFKHNVQNVTNCESKISESVKYEPSRDHTINNNCQELLKKPTFTAGDLITGNVLKEKEYKFVKYLSAIIKIKQNVKKHHYNIPAELRESYKQLDKESTGWLPLEQVYTICYEKNIRPNKKSFGLALNSISAIDNTNVRYDVFVDLLDPNVKFTAIYSNNKEPESDRFITTYTNNFQNTFSQCAQFNKNVPLPYKYVKPITLAHQECWGSETDVKTLLNPSIFTNYGLTYRDFYEERSKDEMEKLFQDVGLNLTTDIFNNIWDNAYRIDGVNGNVCIAVFKQVTDNQAQTIIDHPE